MAVLEQQAVLLGLQDYFRFTKTNIYSRTNLSKFIFKGLRRDINAIRSTEGIDICWIEEGQTTSEKAIKNLIPTIIRRPGAELWVSYNPDQKDDPIHKWANSLNPKNATVETVNYDENPWIDQAFIEEAEAMRDRDYDEYAHVYLGECWTRSDAQVLNGKWQVDDFTFEQRTDGSWLLNGVPTLDVSGPYYGSDWGFATDPTVLVRCFIVGNTLYVDYEVCRVGLEIRDTAAAFKAVPGADKHKIFADSARPETISHLRQDLNIHPVNKWPGSVEDGIARLRSFDRIMVHPRCKETIQECRLYSHKVDRLSGIVMPDIVDKNNHCIDALRYALNNIIKHLPSGDVVII